MRVFRIVLSILQPAWVRSARYAVASGDLSNAAAVEHAPSITAHSAPRTVGEESVLLEHELFYREERMR